MDLKEIKALYKFFKGSDLVELETEGESGRIRFKRGDGTSVERVLRVEEQVLAAQAPVTQATAEPEAPQENIEIISSPMVGTFYRAPSPEASSFIELGDIVKKGQPICIIEAMKLMNDVESEVAGKVVDIMVDNGQPVEYGEPLVKIEV